MRNINEEHIEKQQENVVSNDNDKTNKENVNKKVREEDATQRQSTGKQIEKKTEWEMRNINEEHIRRTTRRGEGRRPPLHFFENKKKCPDFVEICPDCVHP